VKRRTLLAQRRLELGLSQEGLAQRIVDRGWAISADTVLRAEAGHVIRKLTASRLLLALDVHRNEWPSYFPEFFATEQEASA
jgi:hypothetical protein